MDFKREREEEAEEKKQKKRRDHGTYPSCKKT
jgi:hypothetical protein